MVAQEKTLGVQSRLIISLVLLVLVIALGVFLTVTRPGKDMIDSNTVLTGLQAEDINRITITRQDKKKIHFSRQGNVWFMQEPYQLAANPIRIHAILSLANAYSYTQLDAGTLDLQRLQLDPPNLTIHLNDTGFRFGDASPLGKQRYVLLDQTVHLVNDSIYLQLQAPASFFLETRIVPPDANIQAIEYNKYTITQTGDGWQIAPRIEADNADPDAIINAWQSAEALSVREYELHEVTQKVTLQFQERPGITFDVAISESGMVLGRADLQLQYHLSRYDFERMFINMQEETITPELE